MNSNDKWIEMENDRCKAEAESRNLEDTTFIIPFRYDSPERMENLLCICRFLNAHFHTRILVIEDIGNQVRSVYFPQIRPPHSSLSTINHMVIPFREDNVFHRTAVINSGIKTLSTPYFAIYDADCIFNPESIIAAHKLLHEGASMVYPYGGKFVDIERSYIADGVIMELESYATDSVGGAVFLNTAAYRAAGGENENLISHCPDDGERYARMNILGHRIERVSGTCWHLEHPTAANSPVNSFTAANMAEYGKVKAMGRVELENYIKTWGWNK